MIPGGRHAVVAPRTDWGQAWNPVLVFGGLILGLAGCLVLPPLLLGGTLVILTGALARTGLGWHAQVRAARPWLPMLALILLIHIFTTLSAAPLGTPTLAGLVAGLLALLRLACTFGWLGLYSRLATQDDLVVAVRWWLRPLEKVGVPIGDLGLVLAVALGTAPVVLGEGRRIETSLKLRRTGPRREGPSRGTGRWQRWRRSLQDRALVAVPLLESLARRADTLTLSLRSRRPGQEQDPALTVPLVGLGLLLLWLLALVAVGLGPEVTP